MNEITLPLESNIYISKNGETRTEHTVFVTGIVGQEFAEAAVQLMGGSIEEIVREADQENQAREASCG